MKHGANLREMNSKKKTRMNKPSFEESIPIIEEQIEKRRNKWNIKINYIDFDDVKQLLFLHIYKKWYQFDPSRGELSHWISAICSAQIKNHWRNFLGSALPPCNGCAADEGGDKCRIYQLKDSSKCQLLAKWEKTKKEKYNLSLATNIEGQENILIYDSGQIHDYESAQKKISDLLKIKLTKKQYKVYKLLYIDHLTDDEARKALGYDDKNKKPGYSIIFNYKKVIIQRAREILKEHDII